MTTSAANVLAVARSAGDISATSSDPPDRADHSPRSRVIFWASAGSPTIIIRKFGDTGEPGGTAVRIGFGGWGRGLLRLIAAAKEADD